MNIIKCCRCKKGLPEASFSMFHGRLNRSCKDCRNYHNGFYKENRDGYRDHRKKYYRENKRQHGERTYRNLLKSKYGITIEDFKAMLERQVGKCLLCGKCFNEMQGWNKPCVDHDHKTGKVRGILCRRCNLSLSYLENNDLLKKASEYLQVKDVEDKEPSR